MKLFRLPRRIWLILFIVLGIVLTNLIVPFFGLPGIQLVRQTKTTAATDMLHEMRDLLRFNTVQYVYKIIFPYDFQKPGVNNERIIAKLGSNILQSPSKIAAFLQNPSAILNDDELLFLRTDLLCQKIGLNYQAPQYQFLVVTVLVEAGYDLGDSGFDDRGNPKQARPDQILRVETIGPSRQGQAAGQRAVIRLPAPKITDIRIEDRDQNGEKTGDGFPAVTISPGQWQLIADFIVGYYQNQATTTAILTDARRNAKQLLGGFISGLGFDQIIFETR